MHSKSKIKYNNIMYAVRKSHLAEMCFGQRLDDT